MQTEAPAAEYWPSGQLLQIPIVLYVLAAQFEQPVVEATPAIEVWVPRAQTAHPRATPTPILPAAQLVHVASPDTLYYPYQLEYFI